MIYDFHERLNFSKGVRQENDIDTLLAWRGLGAKTVRKTDIDEDRKGIDYVIVLDGGAEVSVDAKARQKGCAKYWQGVPELALEIWSVCPLDWCEFQYAKGRGTPKTGWTLDQSKSVDLILFTFDPADSRDVFLLPFQLLRTAFRQHLGDWLSTYPTPIQTSGAWQSQCCFVPVDVVQSAILSVQKGDLVDMDLQAESSMQGALL